MKKLILLPATTAFILILIASATAITITPGIIDAKDLDRANTYTYESYIINNNQETETIELKITPRSMYLEPYISITPESMTLESGKKKTIKINITIPADSTALTNGTHTLTILPDIIKENTAGVKLISTSIIELRFNIPGFVKDTLELETFNIPDTKEKDPLIFELHAKNTGNIRIRAIPYIDLYHYADIIKTIQGTTQYTIEPGKSQKITVIQNNPGLDSGKYKAQAYLIYSGSKKSNILEQNFRILSPKKSASDPQPTPKSKDPRYTPSEETIYPLYENEKTISIGNPDKLPPIADEKMQHTTPVVGEIIIKTLTAESEGPTTHIALVLENTGSIDLDYELLLNIYSASQKKVMTMISSGIIKGKETLEIKKTWTPETYGNYTIMAEISYDKENNIIEKLKKETFIHIKSPENNLTGLVLGASSIPLTPMAVVLSFIMLSTLAFRMKTKRITLIKAASDSYRDVERNLQQISKKTAELKEKIMNLRFKNDYKETKK